MTKAVEYAVLVLVCGAAATLVSTTVGNAVAGMINNLTEALILMQ